MPAELIAYPDRATLMQALADTVSAELAAGIATNGRASLAVPGGTTPAPFLAALTHADLPWRQVSILLTDERFVPETSDRSNTRLVRETLLRGNAGAAHFIPFYVPADRPEDVLADLADAVELALPLTVCVLGMGEDMHTASLFPGADRLAAALDDGAPALMAMRAPGAPEPRITLTAPVLRGAANTHVLITGAAKRAALDSAMQAGAVAEAPIRAILSGPGPVTVHWAP
jgi:6-phosphogluconolactonase